jgi:HK97 family phage portal protein
MAIVSGGELVLADTSPTFARTTYWTPEGVGLTGKFASYSAIYRQQLWIFVVVQKLALGTARLPFKIYRRGDTGRDDARDTPFAELLRQPNPKHDPFFFWLWTASTFNVFGEALWVKVRNADRSVKELWPLHPVNVFTRNENGTLTYYFYGNASTEPQFAIPAGDVVHFKAYNPDTTVRGMSPIEPLRQTLLNEDAARRATASFWQRGARPALALSHPGVLSQSAADRLKARWDAVAAGADKTGATVVLEEGMKPEVLSLNMEEAQYESTRKLNREECCAAYDVPPPVVHILDHATYSNITEQMRSMYRDTMAPRLSLFESVVDTQLRPDFDTTGELYGEFLMDEVLRGDFEIRAEAYQKAINSGWMSPAEARVLENLPAVDGSDRLFINATLIPIDEASQHTSPNPPAENDPAPPGLAPMPAPNMPVAASNGNGSSQN